MYRSSPLICSIVQGHGGKRILLTPLSLLCHISQASRLEISLIPDLIKNLNVCHATPFRDT